MKQIPMQLTGAGSKACKFTLNFMPSVKPFVVPVSPAFAPARPGRCRWNGSIVPEDGTSATFMIREQINYELLRAATQHAVTQSCGRKACVFRLLPNITVLIT
jgi:hypothetical protein